MVHLYRTMVLSRYLDERSWLLNRQGKAAIAASAQGHEAAQVACIEATDPSKDHYLIYYRQLAAIMALGTTPEEMLRGFLAKEGEPMSGARQFPYHGAHPRVDMFNFSNVIATQIPQAAGFSIAAIEDATAADNIYVTLIQNRGCNFRSSFGFFP
jgi:2-oxoisovalerate dehydrogenase E1 component alpha subunit